MVDVLIIGAGPAGLSAAINVRQRGGSVLVLTNPKENNPLWKAERVDNYPGLPGLTGRELLVKLEEHTRLSGAEIKEGRVLNAFYNAGSWMVSAGTDVYEGKKLIFAGGVVRGRKYPGEEEFVGRGVSYCATCDGMLYRNRKVTVIGFNPSDKHEADYLNGIGCIAEYYEKPKNVEIIGTDLVEKVLIDGKEQDTSCVFILRPAVSPTELFPGIETDGKAIKVDRMMRTNLPGLFAAGDCTGAPLQVAKAVGEGMIAGQIAMT